MVGAGQAARDNFIEPFSQRFYRPLRMANEGQVVNG
jgi:hypothetical protein